MPKPTDNMPEVLKSFLYNLSVKDADAIWEYLDGDPTAPDRMITIVSGITDVTGYRHEKEKEEKR